MTAFKTYCRNHKSLLIAVLFLILSALFILPFMRSYQPFIAGDDSQFHLSRTYSLYNTLKSGHLLPGYDYMAFHNVGTLVNVFYPYLTTSLPIALLQGLTHHWLLSYKIFFFITTWLTLYMAYFATYRLTKRRETGVIFAILYTFCTYRIDVTYPRFDLGEYAVFMVLPLIFIGFELMLQKQDYAKWLWLAGGMTFVLYSHLLSALLITLVLVVRLLMHCRHYTKSLWLSLAKAVGVTSLLSLYQLISILEQFQLQALNTVHTDKLTRILKDPADLLVNSLNNSLYVYTIGFFGVLALFLILTNFNKLNFQGIHYGPFVFLGVLTFLLTSKLFPWKHFNHTAVTILQYPYRFTLFASFFLLLVGAVIVTQLLDANAQNHGWPLLAIGLVFLLVFARSIDDVLHKADKVTAAQYPEITYFRMADFENATIKDYIPKAADTQWSKIQDHTLLIDNHPVKDFSLSADVDRFILVFHTTKAKQKVVLPILNYQGTVVTNANTKQRLTVTPSAMGTIQVTAAKAGAQKMVVHYRPTVLRVLSALVSLVALFAFGGLNFLKRHGPSNL